MSQHVINRVIIEIHQGSITFGHQMRKFGPNENFSEKSGSLFFPYGPLTSYQKSEKTNEPIPRKSVTNGRTDARHFIGPFRKAVVQ